MPNPTECTCLTCLEMKALRAAERGGPAPYPPTPDGRCTCRTCQEAAARRYREQSEAIGRGYQRGLSGR